MRDAAVGFQCPSCIKEGARGSRQNRAAYGGERSADPRLTTFAIMGINVAVWLAILATGWHESRLVHWLALSPRGICESVADSSRYYPDVASAAQCGFDDGRWIDGVSDGAYWQLVTSMFAQVELWHLASNLIVLFFLGPVVERILGRTRFIALYLVSGLVGSAVVYWLSDVNSSTLGASGAVFGLFGALALLTRRVEADMRFIGVLFAINILGSFRGDVSWQGHLGGLVGGLLVTAIIVYAPQGPRRSTVQWAGVAGVAVLALLAIAARTAVLV